MQRELGETRAELEEALHVNASLLSDVARLEALLHDQRVLNEELATSLSEVHTYIPTHVSH